MDEKKFDEQIREIMCVRCGSQKCFGNDEDVVDCIGNLREKYAKSFIESSDMKKTQQGWVCPKCGLVLSPNTSFCMCSVKITC